MESSHDKVALITGAAAGIGRATAQAFAAEGQSVVVADFSTDGGAETVEAIKAGGGEAFFVKVDVADEESVKAMVAATVRKYGRLDVLVNNAGVSSAAPDVPLHELSTEAFHRVMAINVSGTFMGMKYSIPEMLKNGGGSVINVSSVNGFRGSAGDPSYPTSKHAVIGLTKSAALTYASAGVRVNCIAPGVVKTNMTESIFEDEQTTNWLLSVTPMKRFGTPEEIANLIYFLSSDKAGYITGGCFPVDGGWLAG